MTSSTLFEDSHPDDSPHVFAEVAVPLNVRQTFTYRLLGEMAERALAGSRVVVSLGKKPLTGFIVALHDRLEGEIAEADVKDVDALVDQSPVITEDIIELTRWMADYYYAPWGECLRAALPAGATVIGEQMIEITDAGRIALAAEPELAPSKRDALQALSSRKETSVRELSSRLTKLGRRAGSISAAVRQLDRAGLVRTWHRIGETKLKPKFQNAVRFLPGEGKQLDKRLTEQQQRVVDILKRSESVLSLGELVEAAGVSMAVVRNLEKRGLIEIFPREVRRDPLAHIKKEPTGPVSLTPDQRQVLDRIVQKIDQAEYATFLLHGVTSSGKTEIYLNAMAEAVSRGRTAMMLIPEISLSPVFSRRLRNRFGEAVAILHSSLSEGERVDEWRRIRRGEAKIVIGTRSAVFAPLQNLGVVVVDEEHDTSYKQDDSPRYNGRDSAIVRAVNAKATVILGSATPSLESFHNARTGKYIYLRLGSRFGGRPLAAVEAIDMREVFRRHGKRQVISDELKVAIQAAYERGEQTIVLLNRRGYSSFLLCRSCGNSVRCVNCDVSLTYHRFDASLQCHYCNYIRPVPNVCPVCEGLYIHYVGEGTEQIEAILRDLFPLMKIARLDRDTTRKRGSYEHTIMEFASGTIDMLVGTQMIAKGHDFPNVTLVGVISIDVGLSLPDFRAAERTFQLLTQVAGRAGRGERPGRVLIQSYHPEHYALTCAKTQDYDEFYNREIEFRRSMHYPPFSALINVLVSDKDRDRASETASAIARALRGAALDPSLRVLGPAPAPLTRLRGEYRFQVLIKTRKRNVARETLDRAMDQFKRSGNNAQKIAVEVDPVDLM